MANLKTTGVTSEPAVSTEKELPFTRQSIEIQNGKALVQEISAAMIEEREHTQSSDENTKQEYCPALRNTQTISHRRNHCRRRNSQMDTGDGRRLGIFSEMEAKP